MANGNEIVVSAERNGRTISGFLLGVIYPGTWVELDPAVEPIGGKFTYRVYQPGTSGQSRQALIVDIDKSGGRPATAAYASGDLANLYAPVNGEELNILVQDVAGTGDTYAIGDLLTGITGTGLFVKTTEDAVKQIPFICLETLTALTANKLVWARYTGT